jgi:hypothetical protein
MGPTTIQHVMTKEQHNAPRTDTRSTGQASHLSRLISFLLTRQHYYDNIKGNFLNKFWYAGSKSGYKYLQSLHSFIYWILSQNCAPSSPCVSFLLVFFIFINHFVEMWCFVRSAVGIATCYGLDDQEVGVRVPGGSRIVFSPRRPERFWGPPSLLSNGYRELFSRA